jgi:hypothetical protein
MMKSLTRLTLLVVLGSATGCGAAARSPEQYRDDTAALLETQNGAIKLCYDDLLKTDAHVSGKVAIRFTVKEATGELTEPKIDPASTTAPEKLSQCILTAISTLKLQPADAQDGQATFVYDFHVNPPLPAAAAPAAPPG